MHFKSNSELFRSGLLEYHTITPLSALVMVLYGPCSILLQQENPVPGQEVISCDTSLHIPPSPERQGRGDSQGTILEPQLTSGVLAHSLKIVAVGEKIE